MPVPANVPAEFPAAVADRVQAAAIRLRMPPEPVYRAVGAATLRGLPERADVCFGVADDEGEARPVHVRIPPDASLASLVRAWADESRTRPGAVGRLFGTVPAVDVEAAPEGWPLVFRMRAQVAVVPHVDGPGGRHLVAYVQGRDVDPAAPRAEVARTLPDYMVPTVVTALDEFPRTTTDAERTLCEGYPARFTATDGPHPERPANLRRLLAPLGLDGGALAAIGPLLADVVRS